MRTHEWAPRVLIANSNLVGDWATWPEFRRLEQLGLTMYGQMTAGSWIYIGTQGILQGTYETFAAVAAKRFGGTLAGTLTLTGGCGGMGGAQPLAVTMNGGVCLVVDVDPTRLAPPRRAPLPRRGRRRPRRRHRQALRGRRSASAALSVGVVGNAPRCCPSCCAAGVADRHRHRPDLAPTTRCPTCPRASRSTTGRTTPRAKPEEFTDRARDVDGRATSRRWSASWTPAPRSSTTATPSAARPSLGGYERAFDFPGFVPAYIRPLFCEGKGPFRWAALSGDPADIAATDRAVLDLFPENEPPAPLDPRWRRSGCAFQGLPARICWLGYGERDKAGLRVQRDGRRRASVARRS